MILLLGYIFLGIVVGFMGGLFGIGGGVFIVPFLYFVFNFLDFCPNFQIHLAVGTSLASIIITSCASTYFHNIKDGIRWDFFQKMVLGIAIGALFGATVSIKIPETSLKLALVVFYLTIAISIFWTSSFKLINAMLTGSVVTSIYGFFSGVCSSLLGIGGGSLTVPYFNAIGFKMAQSIGTASACGIPIALSGTLGFIIAGWGTTSLPNYSLGFVYLPAFFGISFGTLISVQYGVSVAHSLDDKILKMLFALFLFGASIALIMS